MKSFDGSTRKRIFLFRHGEVSYLDEKGQAVRDPTKVCLTEKGKKQAIMIDENTKDFYFQKIACSGLLRTKQTAEHLLKRRNLQLEILPELEEIKGGTEKSDIRPDIYKDIAYHFENITTNKDKFFGSGEEYYTFRNRVISNIEKILKQEWNSMALILHGGVNAVILSWISDLSISGAGKFDQVPGCMNILDIDLDQDNKIKRKIIRALNVPPDLYRSELSELTSWEGVAKEIEPFFKN
ncbi:MAG: histidine phosphatase family protein [SAR86 cluster bacterium]|nr:histidine phosphatase family protein [SAR86 cluster bacterium]